MQFKPSTTTGLLHGLVGCAVAAYLYMKGIDWDFSAVDYDRAAEWVLGVGTLIGITNKRNREIDSPTQMPAPTNSKLPQGIRTNNPGNLRPLGGGQKWKGQASILQTKNGRYLTFDSPYYGIRAAARNLKNQQRLHGLKTIESIISKWAPESDNNHTAAYVVFLVRKTGFGENEVLDLENDKTAVKLLKAIFHFENGIDYYATAMIVEGVKSA